ncbi:hypothetical protein BJ546DRAFT_1108531 [Cryomyces antarcticus]|uniref:Inhibitor I9 domain-containing protein n=1 Tax=Cryomyces antarcticus TaxID=329879 RepID=A0ABR0KKB4_9PEZI|nr:hypothetical protein LTR60_007843 [Cryomyces antarcticus]KAK5018374.1 hypothetical protein LTR39_001023 [Cryomyces antarcticus]KAK5098930.1 hypothetical protein LTR16_007200 [Cryomyces antarcticus]
MRLAILSILLALLVVCTLAAAPQKAVIVSYPKDTPDFVIAQAQNAIKEAGGIITHEYKLIKAFAANAPAKALESVQAWGAQYNAVIEEDQVVSINGNGH